MTHDLFTEACGISRAFAKLAADQRLMDRRRWSGCVDMMCGAADCPHCHPGCQRQVEIDTDHREDAAYWDERERKQLTNHGDMR